MTLSDGARLAGTGAASTGGGDTVEDIYKAIAGDVRNPAGHARAGRFYHDLFRAGDEDAFVLAETAYSVAVRISDGEPRYRKLLGLLYLDASRYGDATAMLLGALEPGVHDDDLLENVAYSLWQSGEYAAGLWALERLAGERPLTVPEQARVALAAAAVGDAVKAHHYRDRYAVGGGAGAERLAGLVDAWLLLAGDGSAGDGAAVMVEGRETGGAGEDNVADPLAWYDCRQRVSPPDPMARQGGFYVGSDREYQEFLRFIRPPAALPAPCRGGALPKTAMAEVTFIKTFSAAGSHAGINLLQNLELVFNFSKSRSQRRSVLSGASGEVASTMTERLLSAGIGTPFAGIKYALNIAGATEETARIDTRPTVALLDRFPSTFFSGALITLGQQGQYGSSFKEKPVGIAVNITPTFLGDEDILLAVKVAGSDFAERAFVPGTFDESLIVLHETLVTYARLRVGETMVISELVEKIRQRDMSKVPLLGDVPVLGALFKSDVSDDIRENITVLITLHGGRAGAQGGGAPAVTSREDMHPLLRAALERYLGTFDTVAEAVDAAAVRRLYASSEAFFARSGTGVLELGRGKD